MFRQVNAVLIAWCRPRERPARVLMVRGIRKRTGWPRALWNKRTESGLTTHTERNLVTAGLFHFLSCNTGCLSSYDSTDIYALVLSLKWQAARQGDSSIRDHVCCAMITDRLTRMRSCSSASCYNCRSARVLLVFIAKPRVRCSSLVGLVLRVQKKKAYVVTTALIYVTCFNFSSSSWWHCGNASARELRERDLAGVHDGSEGSAILSFFFFCLLNPEERTITLQGVGVSLNVHSFKTYMRKTKMVRSFFFFFLKYFKRTLNLWLKA